VRPQRPSLARVLLTLLGMLLGGGVGFVAGTLLFLLLMRCADPTGTTCVDRHGFLSIGLGMLFGLPIGATVGGWSADVAFDYTG
jgi:hypothetical protein